MAKLLNDERETHINMVHGSNKMKIYTTEYNIMKKLDRYVENNENWKVVEVGKLDLYGSAHFFLSDLK